MIQRPYRVLVCGGRDYSDYEYLASALDAIHRARPLRPITCIIHGGARGADSLAGKWAFERNVQVQVFMADWNAHRLGAGPIRNQKMIDEGEPDLVIAFRGGRGTADMIARTRRAGIDLITQRAA